jgi:formylglycine-generating enzyme required for sulfatase activity
MDATEVTNRQFAEFVQTTGYVTVAEQRQWSLVFDRPTGRWRKMAGADWRHPGGPDSTIVGRDALPVVHVSWHDASAFAAWAEKSLPTEAQFEFAARGGVHDRDYPWGQDVAQSTKFANTWQGAFPDADQELDGASGLAAVGEYSPNPFGLYDIVGNVREWCAAPTAARSEPGLRGGSWVSTAEGGTLFVWARQTAPAKFTDNRTGFRCVKKGEFGMTNDEGLMTKE